MKDAFKMTLTKSTKGTHVYANPEASVKTLYINRSSLPAPAPKTITVTVEHDDE